jgi:hypothetical protein
LFRGGFRFGQCTCRLRRRGLLLGGTACRRGTFGFGFLFGAASRVGSRLGFSGRARQGRGFGELLGVQLPGGLIGSPAFGCGTLGGQPGQFLFLRDPRCGGTRELNGGLFIAPCFLQRALLCLDSNAQRSFRQTFRFGLLGGKLRLDGQSVDLRHAGLLLGGEVCGGGAAGFGFQLGTAQRLLRCLLFGRHARQGCCFGKLLDSHLLDDPIGRASLGFGTLGRQLGQLLFFSGPDHGGAGQFGGGPLFALSFRQRALLRGETRGGGAARLDFLFSAAPGFLRCLLVCRCMRQDCGFGELLDPQLFGGLDGSAMLGFGTL